MTTLIHILFLAFNCTIHPANAQCSGSIKSVKRMKEIKKDTMAGIKIAGNIIKKYNFSVLHKSARPAIEMRKKTLFRACPN